MATTKTNDEQKIPSSSSDEQNKPKDGPWSKTPQARILDDLGLTLPCCRANLMTSVDINQIMLISDARQRVQDELRRVGVIAVREQEPDFVPLTPEQETRWFY
jgi:DNA-directed RNA polymerase subunit N (RpoN/RPB10)